MKAVKLPTLLEGEALDSIMVGTQRCWILVTSVSLIRQDIAKCLNGMTSTGDAPKLRLVSAGG